MSLIARTAFTSVSILVLLTSSVVCQNLPILELDKPTERELKGGQEHDFVLDLAAEQFVHFDVVQKGIDVVVTVYSPNGTKVEEVDSPNGREGPELVWFATATSGPFKVTVKSLEPTSPAGKILE